MSIFPNEIIKIVCQDLSHRDLFNIYNKKQLNKFIDFAITTTTTISKVNSQPVCNLVKQIIIDDFYKWDNLTQQDLKCLHNACPNIKSLDGFELVSTIGGLTFYELPNWHQWVQVPRWLTERDRQLYQCIQPNNNYQSLEFSVLREMVQWTDDNHGNNEKTKNKKGFYLQGWKDNQLQKLKACDCFFAFNSHNIPQPQPAVTTENGLEEVNYYYYYSQIITLPTTISFMHLNHLLLDFEEWNRTSTSQLDILKFDERIIESIHQACPILGSLHLREFNMNLSNQYRTFMKSTSSTIKPCLTLKQLTLEFCFFLHP
ncbi:unnamed protein product [Cunninghamella echinulata]